MPEPGGGPKPVVFTSHARQRMRERGAREEDVLEAIRIGVREPAQRGFFLHRLNLEYKREWDGRYYGVQPVAPVVTVFAFCFQEGERR